MIFIVQITQNHSHTAPLHMQNLHKTRKERKVEMKRVFCTMLALLLCFALPLTAYAEVASEGVFTLAGTGSQGHAGGLDAMFNMPLGIAVQTTEWETNILVADTFNGMIRRLQVHNFWVSDFAGTLTDPGEDGFPLGGHRDDSVWNASFRRPAGIAVNPLGHVYVADAQNNAIRVIMGQNVFTAAGGLDEGFANGNGLDALFSRPGAIAVCPSGNVYIADTGNHAIRMLDQLGNVTTIAGVPGEHGYENGNAQNALFDSPMGIAVSQSGRVYVADTGNHVIRVIENGAVRTLAGSRLFFDEENDDAYPIGGLTDGVASNSHFNGPMGLHLLDGVLLVADSGNHAIRAIANGRVFTFAGTGIPGYLDGRLDAALFHSPGGVHVFGDLLLIADTGNNKIRAISLYEVLEPL